MTYQEALDYMASLEPRGWRLGLDRMQELVRRAGLETAIGGEVGPKFIHVAGTNGKGSVTAFLQSLLIESGHKTGAFFSPFVVDPRERVQVGRQLIPKDDLARWTERLIPIAESLSETEFGGVTEFEFKTALGFAYWMEKNCEWVALEVGLGGRLDSTNVVQPRSCATVSIGLDHTSILGNTLQEIAFEKAGILKPGIPAVIGELPDEAMAEVERVAAEVGAPLWRVGREVVYRNASDTVTIEGPDFRYDNLKPSLIGSKQAHNLAVAVACLVAAGIKPTLEQVRLGAANAIAPGRFQRIEYNGKTIILDGAHNADAARVLAETFRKEYPGKKVILVTGMVAGHDPADFYNPLKEITETAIATRIDFHRTRAESEIAETLSHLGIHNTTAPTAREALKAALKGENDLILVAGSFYLVGEIARELV